MIVEEKMAEVIRRTYAKSKSGDIEWKTTINPGVYRASFGNYSVEVSQERYYDREDQEDVVNYIFGLYNDKGVLVELVRPGDVGEYLQNSYQVIKDLYQSARRRALRVDEVLDEVLRDTE